MQLQGFGSLPTKQVSLHLQQPGALALWSCCCSSPVALPQHDSNRFGSCHTQPDLPEESFFCFWVGSLAWTRVSLQVASLLIWTCLTSAMCLEKSSQVPACKVPDDTAILWFSPKSNNIRTTEMRVISPHALLNMAWDMHKVRRRIAILTCQANCPALRNKCRFSSKGSYPTLLLHTGMDPPPPPRLPMCVCVCVRGGGGGGARLTCGKRSMSSPPGATVFLRSPLMSQTRTV